MDWMNSSVQSIISYLAQAFIQSDVVHLTNRIWNNVGLRALLHQLCRSYHDFNKISFLSPLS